MKRIVVAIVLASIAVACSDEPAVTPSPSPTAAPEASPSAVTALLVRNPPDAGRILVEGESVSYRVCHRVTGWRRPGLDEMQRVFTDTRLGDGHLPFPAGYVYYLEDVYYVQHPTALSANREWSAVSGFWSNTGTAEHLCDPPEVTALVGRFGAPAKSDLPWYQSLQLVGQRVTEMKRIGADLVVVVDTAPATRESIYFPDPADPTFFTSPLGFETVQLVDTSGALIHVESRYPTIPWFERVQYARDGQIDALILAGDSSASSIPSTRFAIPSGQDSLTLYAGFGPPLRSYPAGMLVALDAAGNELERYSWPEPQALWEPLATVALPPQPNESASRL